MGDVSVLAKLRQQPLAVKVWTDRLLHVYCGDRIGEAPATDLDMRINDMSHVERFERTEGWHSRDEFIAECRRRIETPDMYVVTIADRTGPLLGYVYAQANARDSYFPYVDRRLHWPKGTATTYGAYVHPSARGRRLNRMLGVKRNELLFGELGMRWLASAIKSDNAASIKSSTRGPSRIVADVGLSYRFGRETKSFVRHESVHPDFHFEVE